MIRNAIAESDTRKDWLVELVADCLKLPVEELDPTVPLSRYGLDSLAAVQLTTAIGSELDRDLPDDLLLDHPDIASLQQYLNRSQADVLFRLRREGSESNPWRQMNDDAQLPEDVIPRPGSRACDAPRTILLTGATGFLGAHLLAALLEQTSADVICLVRQARDTTEPTRRVRDNLARYRLWNPAYGNRIEVVPGDLLRPRLGLDPTSYIELCRSADVIYHGAAAVNWVFPYGGLRDLNVLGTLEMLRLACRERPKTFHFISSLATCYSTVGTEAVTERSDSWDHLRGLHFGYAQSKCVAESLVRAASDRGLPATIVRPGLILGDRRSGLSSPDDLLPSMIRGCIRMGAAPDLDWQLASCPVDHVADAIVALSRRPTSSLDVYHLTGSPQRNWREVVLWLNLFGYRLPLIPFRDWLTRLEVEAASSEHPLHSLRPFFRLEPRGSGGLTLPELLSLPTARRVCGARTDALLTELSRPRAAVNARLLDRCVRSLIERQLLSPTDRHREAMTDRVGGAAEQPGGGSDKAFGAVSPPSSHSPWIEILTQVLRSHDQDPGLRISELVTLNETWENSIASELTAWRHGTRAGLFRFKAVVKSAHAASEQTRELFVKAKPADVDVMDVLQSVSTLCSNTAGAAFARFRDRLGIRRCHDREIAIYRQTDSRFCDHLPRLYGHLQDDAQRQWILVMESLSGLELLDSVDDPAAWSREHVESAVRGIAAVHAVWLGRDAELRAQPWLGAVPSASEMQEMSDWWRAIHDYAQRYFSCWLDTAPQAQLDELVDTVPDWWSRLERLPRTLIHNDFNPRNLAFRRSRRSRRSRREEAGGLRLCAYDWELACLGLPQRDLAELLCFVLPPSAAAESAPYYLELHRQALQQSSGRTIDRDQWRDGFGIALRDLMLQRLPLYALVHTFRPQRFLERVVRTWQALFTIK